MQRFLPLVVAVAALAAGQGAPRSAYGKPAGKPAGKPQPAGKPTVKMTYFALDNGDAALMEVPGGTKILIGTGGPGDGPGLVRTLNRRGLKKVDALMIPTWGERCIGSGVYVLRHLGVKQIYHNPVFARTKSSAPMYETAKVLEKASKTRVAAPAPGETITLFYTPPVQLQAVAPTGPMLARFEGDPACSMITELSINRVSFLNLGETTRKHQQAMWDHVYPRPWGQVLAIGRNGGEGAILPAMLKPLRTRYAVLSIPRKSRQKPAASTLQLLKNAGVKVYRTDQDGTVTVTTDGEQIHITAGN